MNNPTDTNQASEDNALEDLLNELAHSVGEAAITANRAGENFEYHAFDSICEANEAIESLIRTEKLKLLAEVRERVVGRNQSLPKRGDISPDIYVELIHRVEGRNALRAEQLKSLTKLEAEL